MSAQTLDDFEDLSRWTAIASGQALLSLSPAPGPGGAALRMAFDFRGGGGFVVARRDYAPRLPESYAFSFDVRGHGPGNSLEFKLVDASRENVWRWRQEVFELNDDWRSVRIRDSELPFAWGPLGGGPARDIAALELVVAAGPGGRGEVCIANLRFEDSSYYLVPTVEASSALPGCEPHSLLDAAPATVWRSAAGGPQQLRIDFQQVREFGGLTIRWERPPLAFDLLLSRDGIVWHTVLSADQGVGSETHAYLPGAAARCVRLDLRESATEQGFGIAGIEVQPHAFSQSINEFFSAIARRAAPGLFPKYLLGRQTYWTPVGTGADVTQALFNEEGMVEVDSGSFSIEPLLFAAGKLISWADADVTQTLERGYLPVPSSHWKSGELSLCTTAFATGSSGASTLFIRFCIESTADAPRAVRLFAAIHPFQVTPTWQHWNGFGGVSRIDELAYDAGTVVVNRCKHVIPLSPPEQFGAATFAQGAITEYLRSGELPSRDVVTDTFGYASGALRFDLELPARGGQEVWLAVPFGAAPLPATSADSRHRTSGASEFAHAVGQWQATLGGFDIRLPPAAAAVVDTLRTAAAHILIHRAGPALHPGPRRYSRAWIRDGVLMGAALSRVGLPAAQRDFIRWYAGFQAEDGRLPDCADASGCEWLPEFDCWGQLIFAVMEDYRFCGDEGFLRELWPAVLKSVNYMARLRAQRMTADYQTAEKRACYGLLPESMSHEGYMAHPVHAYWDDFWALRGFNDASAMAGILGEAAEQARIAALCADFQRTLSDSIGQVIDAHQLDFLPGSVEFADFDPSATSIAITLAGALPYLPRKTVEQTYDKYMAGFRQRARGEIPWTNYSAYEIRIIGALLRLGRREEAHELLAFFLSDRRPIAWNQWPEISWRDPHSPSFIGDMPHSWIGAEYILAVRSLFAYERDDDHSLVIAAGVPAHWLQDGDDIAVRDLPTYYGRLSYRLRREGARRFSVALAGALAVPAGGVIVQAPLPGPLRQVTINGRVAGEFDTGWARCDECPADIVLQC